MTETPESYPSKWYPDPCGRHELRWYDGKQWTEHVSDAGVPATDPIPTTPSNLPAVVTPQPTGLMAIAKGRRARRQAMWEKDPANRYPFRFHDGTDWTDLVTMTLGGAPLVDVLHPSDDGVVQSLSSRTADLVRLAALKKRAREIGGLQAAAHRRAQVICPHCQTRGHVSIYHSTQKSGVSGGKAAAAVVTGGKSVWVTGLSGKTATTSAFCSNCGVNWSL